MYAAGDPDGLAAVDDSMYYGEVDVYVPADDVCAYDASAFQPAGFESVDYGASLQAAEDAGGGGAVSERSEVSVSGHKSGSVCMPTSELCFPA